MRVKLAYGRTGLWVDLPDGNVTVVEPRFVEGLPDEEAALRDALCNPLGAPPLRELVCAEGTVAIGFSDITRPQPRERLLPMPGTPAAWEPPPPGKLLCQWTCGSMSLS